MLGRIRAVRLFAAFVVVILFILAAGAGAAQGDAENEADAEPDEIHDELHDLVVRSVDYDGSTEQFSIVVEWTGSTPDTLTLTEMIELDGSGSAGINMQTHRLLPDERVEITIGAAERSSGTAAVLLTTQQSVDEGDALVIQDGEPTDREPVPFDLAALSVGASAVIAVGVSIALVVRRKHAEDKGVDRIA